MIYFTIILVLLLIITLSSNKKEKFSDLSMDDNEVRYITNPSDPHFRYISMNDNAIEVPYYKTWTNTKKFYRSS